MTRHMNDSPIAHNATQCNSGIVRRKSAWFKFYPRDWLSGVAGLSPAERGTYVTLIALMYDRDGAIKRDDRALMRQCGFTAITEYRRALARLIDLGKIVQKDEQLTNPRVETELASRVQNLAAAALNGRLGGQKTQQKQRAFQANAQANAQAIPDTETDIISPSDTNVSSGLVDVAVNQPPAKVTVLAEKRAKRLQSDDGLLREVAAIWNPWAAAHRCRSLQRYTPALAASCRRRISELIKDGDATNTQEAVAFILRQVGNSFFVKGTPRQRLTFAQLFGETFFMKMLNGDFEYQAEERRWRK